MHVFYYILLLGVIVSLWIIAGRYEWQIPNLLVRKISRLMPEEETLPAAVTLNIEAIEFNFDDIEKEIYMIRKSRKSSTNDIVMDVGIEAVEGTLTKDEEDKTKIRLEKRFPGLTVNFSTQKQEEKDAILCTD